MMLPNRVSLFVLTALAATCMVAACGHKDAGGGDDSNATGAGPGTTANSAVLQDNAQVMPRAATDAVDSTASDRLTFPPTGFDSLLNLAAGTVLVGDRQSVTGAGKNPHGFLRKVVSVAKDDSGNVVVMTSGATLMEAAKKFDFEATLQSPKLTTTGPVTQSLTGLKTGPGLRPEGGGMPITLLDFTNTQLLDINDSVNLGGTPPENIGFKAFATVTKGTLDFTPKFDIGGHFDAASALGGILGDGSSLGDAITFHASATGTLDADLELDLGVQLTGNLDNAGFTKLVAQKIFQAKDATLADYPIDLGSLSLGPIGLPVSADFKVVLSCDFAWGGGAEVKVGATAQASVTVGVTYQNSVLTPSFDKSASFTQIGPNWTANGVTKAHCTLKPEFSLNLFDKAMADLWAEGYVSLGANLTCDQSGTGGSSPVLTATVSGEAYAGVKAGLEAKADIFGLVNFDKTCTLFSLESDHAKFSNDITLPSGPMATCMGADSGQTPEPPPDPASCFDGTNSDPGDVKTGTQDGGVVDGCVIMNDSGGAGVSPPDEWSCDASKFGDCQCDCGCGAPDIDCADGTCSGCTHDVCTAGDPLGNMCDDCTMKVCAADAYCCDQYWGPSCFDDVQNLCGKTCDDGSGGSGGSGP